MIKENISLKEFTNYKIGGKARYFLTANNVDELIGDLKNRPSLAQKNQLNPNKIFILGGGTNILIGDQGFDGLVIHTDINNLELMDNNRVTVGSGVTIENLNRYLIKASLSGFEWAGGLPGTVGGAIFGNAGAFGGETKDNIIEVESLDIRTLKIVKRTASECEFGYRNSLFKKILAGREIIFSAVFQFKAGEQSSINQKINEKIAYRSEHQPLNLPSAGSTFKNVAIQDISPELQMKFKQKIKQDPFPVIPAAVFIADAGLIGFSIAGAQVSDCHPNFIVNTGNATSSDVEKLIEYIISQVEKRYGVVLEPEIIRVK